jgi:hypothetical protein
VTFQHQQHGFRGLMGLAGLAAAAALFWLCARPLIWPAFPEEAVRAYESLFEWGQEGRLRGGAVPYRTGKVVTIRPSTWQVYRFGSQMLTQISPDWEGRKEYEIDPPRVDDSWSRLPAEVRAASPAEVGTVIICDYRQSPIREYRGVSDFYGKEGAYRRIVWLKTYDWKRRELIGECALGEDHPDLDYAIAGPFSGDPGEIAAFVATMPLQEEPR